MNNKKHAFIKINSINHVGVYINPDGIYRFPIHKDNFPTQGSPSFSRHNFMFYAAKHEASIRIA